MIKATAPAAKRQRVAEDDKDCKDKEGQRGIWSVVIELPVELRRVWLAILVADWAYSPDACRLQRVCHTLYDDVAAMRERTKQRVVVTKKIAPPHSLFRPIAVRELRVTTENKDLPNHIWDYKCVEDLRIVNDIIAKAPVGAVVQPGHGQLSLELQRVVFDLPKLRRLHVMSHIRGISSLPSRLAASTAPLEELTLKFCVYDEDGHLDDDADIPERWSSLSSMVDKLVDWPRLAHLRVFEFHCFVGDDTVLAVLGKCARLQQLTLTASTLYRKKPDSLPIQFLLAIAKAIVPVAGGSLTHVAIHIDVHDEPADLAGYRAQECASEDAFRAWFPCTAMQSFNVSSKDIDTLWRGVKNIRPKPAMTVDALRTWSDTIQEFMCSLVQLDAEMMAETLHLAPGLRELYAQLPDSVDLTTLTQWFVAHPHLRIQDEYRRPLARRVHVSDPARTAWGVLGRIDIGWDLSLSCSAPSSPKKPLRLSHLSRCITDKSASFRAAPGEAPLVIDDADDEGHSVFANVVDNKSWLAIRTFVVRGELRITERFFEDALRRRMRRILIVNDATSAPAEAFDPKYRRNLPFSEVEKQIQGTSEVDVRDTRVLAERLYATASGQRKRPWTAGIYPSSDESKKTERPAFAVRACIWSVKKMFVWFCEARPIEAAVDDGWNCPHNVTWFWNAVGVARS